MNKIEKILKNKFTLNKMQVEALKLKGVSIKLDAPTGTGKTEAILLNLVEGKYLYFLPTTVSANFMFKRLKDLNICNVVCRTSTLKDSITVNGSDITIELCCPDQFCIDFLSTNYIDKNVTGIILDEIDSYPVMVQRVLIKLMQNSRHSLHIIVASATINKELSNQINNSNIKTISYNTNKKFIKHNIKEITNISELLNFVKNKIKENKKIGFIMNSIKEMNSIHYMLARLELINQNTNLVFLHSRLDGYEKQEMEDKLYNKDFDIVISNDIISYSIDVDFDVLITIPSDKQNLNIQRFGRNNRGNKIIRNFKNLGLITGDLLEDLHDAPFVDDEIQQKNIQILLNYFVDNKIHYQKLNKFRNEMLPQENIPSIDDIKEYWKELKSKQLKKALRQTYLVFRYHFTKKVTKDKKTFEVETFKNFTSNNGIPYSWYPENEYGDKMYIHLYGTTYSLAERDENEQNVINILKANEFDEEYLMERFYNGFGKNIQKRRV